MRNATNYIFALLVVTCSSTCFADNTSDKISVTATVIATCSVSYDAGTSTLDWKPGLDWACTNGASPSLSVTDDSYSKSMDPGSGAIAHQMQSGRLITVTESPGATGDLNITLEF